MTTAADRFWAKVNKEGPISVRRGAPGRCWTWTGGADQNGYGRFWDGTRKVITHRWSYEQGRGPIPLGLVLDHLCRRPACVRPDHLQAVTQAENVRRGLSGLRNASKTHCPAGHAYSDANTRTRNGRRECRPCIRARERQYRKGHQAA
ncbi:HNH endonuclease signature motif containing protein [Streptomyces europaeiscabiei]|uniref:HNH endonuclease signature motif containing protein n=1 Tax=Streptomyces europaeiscabiei TaxID=146819 RepID=UPI000E69DB9E|nr:HNH endonuclease signature motif containing protein [Streptomyces europaeiscabiei]